ncbi:hypothetical protein HUJ05_006975 [Dendroctonus ponderosae]|nr:hypothetical protein HUJ05_006975 [Dendroctonus ponderosae]
MGSEDSAGKGGIKAILKVTLNLDEAFQATTWESQLAIRALKAWTNETHLSVVKAVESAEWLINFRVIFSIFMENAARKSVRLSKGQMRIAGKQMRSHSRWKIFSYYKDSKAGAIKLCLLNRLYLFDSGAFHARTRIFVLYLTVFLSIRVDGRGKSIFQARHWSAPAVFGTRASFKTSTEPAELVVEDVQRRDEGVYRCRVDFRNQQTRSIRYNLTIIAGVK